MKRKIYLELAITLIVGFLIGFFVNSIVTDKRIKDFSMHKGEWFFWKKALNEIQATEEQKQIIFPIIKAYSEETREILHESWQQIPPIWDKMEVEIMQHLTPEQQKKIKLIQDEREKHMREIIKNGPQRQRGQGSGFREDQQTNKEAKQRQNKKQRSNQMPPPPPPPNIE